MESTGSHWKPVFNLLEWRFEVVLVNAHHIKNGSPEKDPSRPVDRDDSEMTAGKSSSPMRMIP